MSIKTEVRDRVAVLAMDVPPVNGLGLPLRRALLAALETANADPAIQAIVLTGAAKVFSGGADIREFGSPDAFAAPDLRAVIAAIEDSPKPVVAAIQGIALGGGLELALGAHYRVVARGTQLGLPEVRLGLLPGAGGTQRLPRAIGVEASLGMITSGGPVPAEQLAQTALIDQLVDAAVLDAALAFAQARAADGSGPWPRLRDRAVDGDHAIPLAAARAQLAATMPALEAPRACVDAVEAGLQRGIEAGLRREGEIFLALMDSAQSRALRHAFFAERAASKVADLGPEVQARRIGHAGVVGAGTMGAGIAMNFLNAGIPVTLVETRQDALERGVATIRGNYEASARKGKLRPEQVEQRMSLLSPSLVLADLGGAELIVEAVFEDYGVKESVFRALDGIARSGAILASNTSTLDIDRIAAFTHRPESVLGMHFFSPANVMKLLEVVRGQATSREVLATVMALARTLGKTAVVSGVCDGFIGNRMIEQYSRAAGFLLDEGALPTQVDRAMEDFGFAMGPFRMGDLAGNDIGWAIRKRRYAERPDMVYPKTADLLCELGRFGQKTGKGWYDYAPGSRSAQPAAEVEAMVVAHSATLGLSRRAISDAEIVARLLYALVNEGARILEEGIAAKASDIDVVYLSGYGFPAWRGGPMHYADEVGLARVLQAIRDFAGGYEGRMWQAAPLLVRLAESGGRFNG